MTETTTVPELVIPASSVLRQLLDAIAADLQVIARIHDREADAALLNELRSVHFPGSLGLSLRSDTARDGEALLARAFDELAVPPSPAQVDEIAADYASIYLNNGWGAAPSESVWIDEDGLVMQEPMFQVRSWYRRHGLSVQNWRTRADDHLVVQLHFLELLFRRGEGNEVAEIARFMDEHLLRWLPEFSHRVASRCATAFYAGVAMLTAAYCDELRDLLAEILGEPRPTAEEIEQRMNPKPAAKVTPVTFVPGLKPSW